MFEGNIRIQASFQKIACKSILADDARQSAFWQGVVFVLLFLAYDSFFVKNKVAMFRTMFGEATRSRRCVNAFGGSRAQEHAKHMNTRFNSRHVIFVGNTWATFRSVYRER